jgi:ribosomal protein L24
VVKRVSLEIKNRKKFKYGIEHKTMPSKAIGMGVCPRCGKPGTVVIKAGNYVYIKHGNTWHYIGTIDKVNLNKILIKNPENITTNKPKTKNKYTATALITIATAIVILSIALLFTLHNNSYNEFTLQGNQESNNLSNIIKSVVQCNYTIIHEAPTLLCNSTNYKITIINVNINAIKNISYNDTILSQ